MEYILLTCTVLLGGIRSILTKSVNKDGKSFYEALKTNAYMFVFAFITVFLIGIASVKTLFQVPWWLTIIYAASMVLAQVCLMKAVEIGSVSTSGLIYYCGFIIALLFGSIYYKEKVNVLHLIGVLLILVSFVLSVKKEKKKVSVLWLITAFGGFLFGGAMGIWQKIFRYEYAEYNLDNFMQVAFLLMSVLSFCLAVLSKLGRIRDKQENEDKGKADDVQAIKATDKWKKIVYIATLGVCMGLINIINTFLAGELPSVIVFPCIYGGGIIATSIFSMIIFKEKTTNKQKFSLLIGIIGIVFIGVGSMFV